MFHIPISNKLSTKSHYAYVWSKALQWTSCQQLPTHEVEIFSRKDKKKRSLTWLHLLTYYNEWLQNDLMSFRAVSSLSVPRLSREAHVSTCFVVFDNVCVAVYGVGVCVDCISLTSYTLLAWAYSEYLCRLCCFIITFTTTDSTCAITDNVGHIGLRPFTCNLASRWPPGSDGVAYFSSLFAAIASPTGSKRRNIERTRELEFYKFLQLLQFKELQEFFSQLKHIRCRTIRYFEIHSRLISCDVPECDIHL